MPFMLDVGSIYPHRLILAISTAKGGGTPLPISSSRPARQCHPRRARPAAPRPATETAARKREENQSLTKAPF